MSGPLSKCQSIGVDSVSFHGFNLYFGGAIRWQGVIHALLMSLVYFLSSTFRIFFSLLFVPGFDKAPRYMTCVSSFFPPKSPQEKKNGKEVTVFSNHLLFQYWLDCTCYF